MKNLLSIGIVILLAISLTGSDFRPGEGQTRATCGSQQSCRRKIS